jgi:hypothetical protein
VNWVVIKDVEKRNLKNHFGRPSLRELKKIAIDEITIGRGHHYLTIVLDLTNGAEVFVGNGKDSEWIPCILEPDESLEGERSDESSKAHSGSTHVPIRV